MQYPKQDLDPYTDPKFTEKQDPDTDPKKNHSVSTILTSRQVTKALSKVGLIDFLDFLLCIGADEKQ